jgi:septal ring factor EnvC (AmiA/AmiB activator)
LNQQDPAAAARNLRYHDYFLQARLEKIQEYQSTLAQLNQTEQALQQALADLREQRNQLAQQQGLLQAQYDDRKRALQNLRGQVKSKGDTLSRLQRDRNTLSKVIAAARSVTRRLPIPEEGTPFAETRGKLAWPVRGKLRNRFGAVREGNLHWEGVIIGASPGTTVAAVHAGRVVFADWLSGLGLLMIIDHGNGYMSLYGHNAVLLREVGEWVHGGDTIARTGDTGAEPAPGLYFEIRYQGEPVDPSRWCQ